MLKALRDSFKQCLKLLGLPIYNDRDDLWLTRRSASSPLQDKIEVYIDESSRASEVINRGIKMHRESIYNDRGDLLLTRRYESSPLQDKLEVNIVSEISGTPDAIDRGREMHRESIGEQSHVDASSEMNVYYLVFTTVASRFATEVFDFRSNNFLVISNYNEEIFREHLLSRGNSDFLIFKNLKEAKGYVDITASGVESRGFTAHPIYEIRMPFEIKQENFKHIYEVAPLDMNFNRERLLAIQSFEAIDTRISEEVERVELGAEEKVDKLNSSYRQQLSAIIAERKDKLIEAEINYGKLLSQSEHTTAVILQHYHSLKSGIESSFNISKTQLNSWYWERVSQINLKKDKKIADLELKKVEDIVQYTKNRERFPVAAVYPKVLEYCMSGCVVFPGKVEKIRDLQVEVASVLFPKSLGDTLEFNIYNFSRTVGLSNISLDSVTSLPESMSYVADLSCFSIERKGSVGSGMNEHFLKAYQEELDISNYCTKRKSSDDDYDKAELKTHALEKRVKAKIN